MLADWDRRLISPERALRLAGDWPVYYTVELATLSQFEPESGAQRLPDQWQIIQRCSKCQQAITTLAHTANVPFAAFGGPEISTADQLSDVLRHMVTAHNQSLSGASS